MLTSLDLVRRLGPAADLQDEEGRPHERQRVGDEDPADARDGEQQSTEGGAEERADALDRRRRHVCGGELLGRLGEQRQQGRLGRAEGLGRDGHEAGEDVDDRRRRAGERRGRHRGHRDDAAQIGGQHHALARIAVGEVREPRRGQRGGDPADDEDGADRLRAAVVVRVDGEGDEEAPLAGDRPGERKLKLAQLPVREDGPKGLASRPAAAETRSWSGESQVRLPFQRNNGRFRGAVARLVG